MTDDGVVHWLADSCDQGKDTEENTTFTIDENKVTCEKCLNILRGKDETL